MVEISFLGHSGVRIQGKKVSLVIDPPTGQILGIETPKKVQADIVLLTQEEVPAHSNLEIVQPSNSETLPADRQVFQISTPGEYEISQTEITGLSASSKGACLPAGRLGFSESNKLTIYHIKLSGINLVFLGTISRLTQNLVEELSQVDILFLPVGGRVSIGPKEATDVMTTLEPAIVVPVHFGTGEKDGLSSIDQFLAQVGKIPTEMADKLQITKDKLPEEVKIVTLRSPTAVSG